MVLGVASLADHTNPARRGTGLFWILLGVAFALGDVLPAWVTGVIVIGMVVIDGLGGVRAAKDYGMPTSEERMQTSSRLGWRIFVPVLMIPVVTYAASLVRWGTEVDLTRVVFVRPRLFVDPRCVRGARIDTRAGDGARGRRKAACRRHRRCRDSPSAPCLVRHTLHSGWCRHGHRAHCGHADSHRQLVRRRYSCVP